jgi:lysophospholipase L1-like esterase
LSVAAAPADASANRAYIGLGDSVAAGSGAPPGRGYVQRYFRYLRDPARGGLHRLVNLAEPGQTSGGMRVAGGQLDRAVRLIRRPRTWSW